MEFYSSAETFPVSWDMVMDLEHFLPWEIGEQLEYPFSLRYLPF
jgi:hypothetical protein